MLRMREAVLSGCQTKNFKEQPKELLKNICEPEFKKTNNIITINIQTGTNANTEQSVKSYIR